MASNSWCLKCNAYAAKLWRLNNPEKAKERDRKKYWRNPEKSREYSLRYYRRNREHNIEKNKQYIDNLRKEVYTAYGSICKCCGETNMKFLTLDHVNNNGKQHRISLVGKNRGGMYETLKWAKENGYPNCLQLACYNCNMGKARNKGVCPHKEQVSTNVW